MSLSPSMTLFGIASRFNATSSAVSEAAVAAASSGAVHAVPWTEPVVSSEWLHANLRDPNVKVLDASWYIPAEQRNPLQEYQVAHIPGALFFDVDGISDRASNAATAAASGAVHAVPRTKPVVSAEWLHANLRDLDVKV
ncbi:hypothetical protein ZWY2020_015875 [Hordeum vulgare]|nr:hypothetical protein ZWY2020_015875 [Hordeum vulgare]